MDSRALEEVMDSLQRYGAGDPDDPKAKTRGRILESASQQFVQFGYRKASVDGIARNAGVAKGTVYLYFKSKAELLMHVIAEEKKETAKRVASILVQTEDPTKRLEAYLEMVFDLISELPVTSALMSGDREILIALDELDSGMIAQVQEQQRTFLRSLLSSVPGNDPETVGEDVAVVLGLLYAAPQIMDGPGRGDIPRTDYARMLARLIVEGVNR